MVAHDHRNITSQLAVALPVQQVDQAVVMPRDKDRHPRPVARQHNPPVHRKLFCNRFELLRKILQIQLKPIEVPFDAGQIEALCAGLVLLKMQDVPTVAEDEIGDGGVEPFAVRTLNQQNGGISQAVSRDSIAGPSPDDFLCAVRQPSAYEVRATSE